MTGPPPSHPRPYVRALHDHRLPVVIFVWDIGSDDIGEEDCGRPPPRRRWMRRREGRRSRCSFRPRLDLSVVLLSS